MLPLHGAPVTLGDQAVELRTAVSAAIYVAGLRPADGPPLPWHRLTRAALEQSFTQSSRDGPR